MNEDKLPTIQEHEIRNSLEILQKIIAELPDGKIKDELVEYKRSCFESMRYSAPEVVNLRHLTTFTELSIMLPALDVGPTVKEKIRKIFTGEDEV